MKKCRVPKKYYRWLMKHALDIYTVQGKIKPAHYEEIAIIGGHLLGTYPCKTRRGRKGEENCYEIHFTSALGSFSCFVDKKDLK